MADLGTILGGRYRLVELLGQGGMATIYRARDNQLERDVAVKVLRPEYGNDPDFFARFRQEAQSAASLNHPGIEAIHGFEDDVRSAQESALRAPILQGVSLQGGRRGREDFQSDRRTELAGRASLTVEGTAG